MNRAALVAHARDSIARGSRSFAAASRLFDPATRERAWLLYAWCRACDDIADGQEMGHGMSRVADAPARLAETLQNEALDLATGFVPDKRALRPLIRFKASAEDWKLEFERSGLRSGAVQYDEANNTLVLTNVPESLKKMLLEG